MVVGDCKISSGFYIPIVDEGSANNGFGCWWCNGPFLVSRGGEGRKQLW